MSQDLVSLSSGFYGRLGTAPCGHRGEAIVGHYYACLEGCDKKGAIPPSQTSRLPEFPGHAGKACVCFHCRVMMTSKHPSCRCTWCRVCREATKLELWAGPIRYTTLPWNGVDRQEWEVKALTRTPQVITGVSWLTDSGNEIARNEFGVLGGSAPSLPLTTTPGMAQRASTKLHLTFGTGRIGLSWGVPATHAHVAVTPATGAIPAAVPIVLPAGPAPTPAAAAPAPVVAVGGGLNTGGTGTTTPASPPVRVTYPLSKP